MAIHEYTKIEGSFAVLSFWVDPQGDGEIHVDFGDRLLVGAPEGDPLASFTDHRPLRWEGLSEDFGSAARARLAECEHSHVACKPSGPAPLPTRVLRIIPQQSSSWPRVRLFVPPRDGPLRRYACLSYCWGGEQDVKLTKANIHALQTNDLDMVTLPLTLRDAIMTAQCLGISYLWIDALCIVQDDEDDKQRELAHMGSIYSRCAVCISAATGESVHDGFLKPAHRPNKLRPMCRITLPPSLNDEFHGILILSPFQFQESEEFAINKRGWTYQEALLAPRTLMFGDIEPLLRCRTEDAIQIHYSGFMYYSDPLSPHIVTNTNVNHYAVEKIKDMYLAMWPDLVSQYTRRRLTVDRDKPVAIQGVIDFLAQKMDDKCYHGIWASSPSTLLWTSSESISIERGASIRNPSVPTWSWMCVAGTNRIVEAAEIIKGSLEAKVRFEASDGSPSVCSRLHVTCRILTAAEVKRAHAFMNFEPDIPLDWASETDLQWLARNELRNKLRDILPEKNIGKLPLADTECPEMVTQIPQPSVLSGGGGGPTQPSRTPPLRLLLFASRVGMGVRLIDRPRGHEYAGGRVPGGVDSRVGAIVWGSGPAPPAHPSAAVVGGPDRKPKGPPCSSAAAAATLSDFFFMSLDGSLGGVAGFMGLASSPSDKMEGRFSHIEQVSHARLAPEDATRAVIPQFSLALQEEPDAEMLVWVCGLVPKPL
ncbi:hypothetical protein GGTG_11163 [Gaeumannomyces tritici R3-111a-1]|uniref:Heterokaryon incompatibility domain-containing protein n=1 Tax=Gaeumannomyces tritici (strain R3-111a-1) TaxID=644352 RepID=J3PCE0_GAET3|nr:hypothetical protein GGTG_11163 [Gaeumannomyces tritici R3-111a-1]EJT71910.1 hypothetical protein GGTG_11163 [Gaeumannomyces tritici R3-111a-1]